MNSNRTSRVLAGLAGSALAAGALVGLTGGAATAVSGPANLDCSVPMFGKDMKYPTTAEITATRAGAGKATVEVKLGDMPGIVPLPLPNVPISGKATATVDGAAATLSGTHVVNLAAAYSPIPAPKMTATVNAASDKVTVAVSKIDFAASAMGTNVDVSCVATSGLTQTVAVTGAAAKVAPKVSVSAKANKKRVATVKVTVGGAQGKATGKVKVTVKKGKKTVKKATVSLKGGKASVKTKKLAKGKYTVTTSYQGSTAYKTGSKKVSFKVK